MRICLLSQEYPPETPWGGIGTQTWLKARGMVQLGHEVHVLSRSLESGPDLRTDIEDGVIVHRMQPPGYDFPIYERQTYQLGYAWYVLRHFDELHSRHPFDVLDIPEFGGEGFAYLLDRTVYNWCPVVVHLHGPLAMFTDHMGWPDRGSRLQQFGGFMERYSIQRADTVCSNSHIVAQIASQYSGLASQEMDVVHCGVDDQLFTPDGPAHEHTRPTILFVGYVVENKGAHIVADAMLRIREKYPDVLLLFLGRHDTECADNIRAKVTAAGADNNVCFAGFVPLTDLPQYYRAADLFSSPAEFEGGTAGTYLEAMACGLPLVVSTAGGGAEAVSDGETGLLVPPNDVAATAAAFDKLLGDAELRRRLAANARRRVEEYFGMLPFARRLLKVYEQGIARSNRELQRLKRIRGLEDETAEAV